MPEITVTDAPEGMTGLYMTLDDKYISAILDGRISADRSELEDFARLICKLYDQLVA